MIWLLIVCNFVERLRDISESSFMSCDVRICIWFKAFLDSSWSWSLSQLQDFQAFTARDLSVVCHCTMHFKQVAMRFNSFSVYAGKVRLWDYV